jgi:ABC-type antimicrobial peptide transport system ATPase subunit
LNAIEAQIELSPKLTFDEALNIEFKSLSFYFMDVLEKRRVAKQKVPKLFGSISKIFQYPQNCIDNSHNLSFIYCFKV